jgi:hypothetical protein
LEEISEGGMDAFSSKSCEHRWSLYVGFVYCTLYVLRFETSE